jgi:hypothetical protein
VESSSASVVQPAATRQSAPRRVRHRAYANTTANPARKQWRHQLGVPCRPTRRAVSAGTLWVATSCCCSLTALAKPNACEPKPISPITATTARLRPAAPATRRRARALDPLDPLDPSLPAPSTRNGSASPAVTLTANPATSAAAPARKRGLAPAVSTSAPASASSNSVSLWSPPTASSSSTGFRPTNAAVKRAEWRPGTVRKPPAPSSDRASFPDARLNSAIAARLVATASPFNAHSPPATPSGAIA